MTPEVARVEDPALLCGQGRFLDDLDPLPGTLVAAIVRSPLPHARITGFDPTAALASPGVAAVIGPRDVATELRPFPLSVRTPMPYFAGATDRVRFVGEPVAVVVATDRYLAEDAAELVDVDYEELPAVTGTQAALAAGAPRLHPGGRKQRRDRPHVQLRTGGGGVRRSRSGGRRRVLLPPLLLHAARVLRRGGELDRNRRRSRRGGLGEFPRPVQHDPGAGWRARRPGGPPPAARARGHRRQLRHQGGHLPVRHADGAGQQARAAPGAMDRGPAGAPGRVFGGRRG